MGWLDDVPNVSMGGGRDPFLPVGRGRYTLEEISEYKFQDGQNGAKVYFRGSDGVRYFRSIKVSTDPKRPYGKRELLALCAALTGIDPRDVERVKAEITPVVMGTILSPAQPCAGTELDLTVVAGKNVNAHGEPYTNVIYEPITQVREAYSREVRAVKAFPPPGWEAHPADPTLYINKAEKRMLSADELRKL